MNVGQKSSLKDCENRLNSIQDRILVIADDICFFQKVKLDKVVNDFDSIPDDNQELINTKHLVNSVGQIGCALECISEALHNVRRVK